MSPSVSSSVSIQRGDLRCRSSRGSTQEEAHITWECVTARVWGCVQASCRRPLAPDRHGGGQRAQRLPDTEAVVGVPGHHLRAVQRDDRIGSRRWGEVDTEVIVNWIPPTVRKHQIPSEKKLKQKIFLVFYDLVVYQNSRRWIPWINLLINQLIISALLKISSVLLFVSLLHSVFTRMFCSKCSVSCFSLQNDRKPFFFIINVWFQSFFFAFFFFLNVRICCYSSAFMTANEESLGLWTVGWTKQATGIDIAMSIFHNFLTCYRQKNQSHRGT